MSRFAYPRRLLLAVLVACWAPVPASSVLIYTWTGGSTFGNWFDGGNWDGGVVPTDGSSIVFGDTANGSRTIYYASSPYEVRVDGFSFLGITRPYLIYGSLDTTYLGAGGITYLPAAPVTSVIRDTIVLKANQPWTVANGTLVIDGAITDYDLNELSVLVSGNFQIEKLGAGTLSIRDDFNGSWEGGLKLTEGRLEIETDTGTVTPLGNGVLTFNGGTLVTRSPESDGAIGLNNEIESNGFVSIENHIELELYGDVLLNGDTNLDVTGKPLHVFGQIHDGDGSYKLTLDSAGVVVLHGSSGWEGGTSVNKGVLIFAGEDNTPGTTDGIYVGSNGYVGITLDQNVGGFLDQVAKGSTGSIGFDTDPEALVADTFSTAVDLSNFTGGIRLGSATRGRLLGNILLPAGATNYRFGGGGGTLTVASLLTGARGIVAESDAETPLTLVVNPDLAIEGSNSFTGGVTATNSAVLFTTSSLPAGNVLNLGDGGYIGMIDGAESTDNFLDMFAPGTNRGMIGFDSVEFVTIPTAISLADFGTGVYLGSATDAVLTGTITPAADGGIRLGGYKGGIIEVASAITGAETKVHVGDPNSRATFADFVHGEYSKVYLTGDNSYGGSTMLHAGELVVGQANRTLEFPDDLIGVVPTTALGTGPLVVQPIAYTSSLYPGEILMPLLNANDDDLIIANPIQLNGSLRLGASEDFELTGVISGVGGLALEDFSDIDLSNDANTFSGGIHFGYSSQLTVKADHATGTGMLTFGGAGTDLTFETANPVVNGLATLEYADVFVNFELGNTTLTINQAVDATFNGYFYAVFDETPEFNGAARIVKTGNGTLRFASGDIEFRDGTPQAGLPDVAIEVRQGTLLIGDDFSFSLTEGAVWVNGGRFTLDYAEIYSEVIVSSGTLAGSGHIQNTVSIASGALLAPGLGAGEPNLGVMSISHLTLNGGGIYEWNIQNPIFDVEAELPMQDLIYVDTPATLEIAATAANPFIIRPITLGTNGVNGMMTGLQENQTYSWMLIHYDAVTNPEVSRFTLDMSQFQTNLSGNYGLSFVSTGGTSGALVLNFTAVPEPSTYALFGLGLGVIAISAWRRAKRR